MVMIKLAVVSHWEVLRTAGKKERNFSARATRVIDMEFITIRLYVAACYVCLILQPMRAAEDCTAILAHGSGNFKLEQFGITLRTQFRVPCCRSSRMAVLSCSDSDGGRSMFLRMKRKCKKPNSIN